MKSLLKPLSLMIVLFSFYSCANGKKLQEGAPSEIGELTYTTWSGGTERSGSGYNLFVELKDPSAVQIDTVYFRGRKAVFEREEGNPNMYVANFRIPARETKSPDIIMHEDPKKEYGNPAPVIPETIPYELQADEAVLRIVKNGKEKFFKMKAIQKENNAGIQIKNPENTSH